MKRYYRNRHASFLKELLGKKEEQKKDEEEKKEEENLLEDYKFDFL